MIVSNVVGNVVAMTDSAELVSSIIEHKIHKDPEGGPGWLCTLCPNGVKIKDKKNVKRHVILKHINTKLVYKCPLCPLVTTYKSQSGLKKHLKVSHNDDTIRTSSCFDFVSS